MESDLCVRTTFDKLITEHAIEIGDGYRARNAELGGEGLIFLRAGHVTDTHIDFAGVDRFHANLGSRVRSKLAQPGDTVVTTKGNSTGRTAFVLPSMPPFVYSPHLSYWRTRNPSRVCAGFLRYWSKSREFVGQLAGMKSSTDMAPYLSLVDQKRLQITLPPIEEQRAIAHVLGTLDDKIELNRRMNRTLEKMAAALFKSWFIDFDPVRAKAEGRDTGLPAEIADLFPDSFEDSELGEIPRGWAVESLPEAIVVNPSRSLSRGTAAPYVEMSAMPTQLSRPAGWPKREFSSGSRFLNGDVLVARITPCLENGKTAFVDFLDGEEIGWGSTEYIVFCSRPPLPPEFTYFLARSDRFREHAITNMTGTSGRQRVPATCFDRFQVTVPPEIVATAFGNMVQPALRKTRANDFQSKKLEKLRDALLPKLLSGELEVPAIVQSKEGEA